MAFFSCEEKSGKAESGMRFCLALMLIVFGAVPARADMIDTAFRDAIALFEAALPQLPAEFQGVDVSTYRDALTLRTFRSTYWGETISLSVRQVSDDRSCNTFAAFVRLPPQDGQLVLTLCPQFSTPGADLLRRLTILHELVHVVAGPSECQAMAFAAGIEKISTGSFMPVEQYWASNDCSASRFSLPD